MIFKRKVSTGEIVSYKQSKQAKKAIAKAAKKSIEDQKAMVALAKKTLSTSH